MFRPPRKVPRVQTKGAEFVIPTTSAHGVNALGPEPGVGRLATELELPLLAVVRTLGAGRRALVS